MIRYFAIMTVLSIAGTSHANEEDLPPMPMSEPFMPSKDAEEYM